MNDVQNKRSPSMSQTWNPQVLVLAETNSTNDYLLQNDIYLCQSGLAVLALSQTAGRGRLGRSWQAGGQGNLACSLSLDPRPYPVPVYSFTLLAGLALRRAVAGWGLEECQLKWPNDLLVRGKKMAGILCESAVSSQGPRLVVGLGVNLSGGVEQFPPELQSVVTTLEAETGRKLGAELLLQFFLRELGCILEQLPQTGLAPWVQAWEGESGSLGQMIYYQGPTGWGQGRILGLAPDGRLRVDKGKEGIQELLSGETSFRPPGC